MTAIEHSVAAPHACPEPGLRDLTPEERLLFACLRQHPRTSDLQRLAAITQEAPINWPLVRAIAREHGVAPLVYANLRRAAAAGAAINAAAIHELKRDVFEAMAQKERTNRQLRELLSYLNQQDIDVMLIKGAALEATLYGERGQVVSLDVDLLVRPLREDVPPMVRAPALAYNRSGPFELSFGRHHDLDMNLMLPVDFAAIWADARAIEHLGCRVFVMSPVNMLLAACITTCRKRYFLLKNIYAIAESIRSGPDIDWEVLVRRARQWRCELIVYTALKTTCLATGVEVPESLWERFDVSRARAWVIGFLAERMSFCRLASRVANLQDKTIRSAGDLKDKGKPSLLLPYASYRPTQVLSRLRQVLRR